MIVQQKALSLYRGQALAPMVRASSIPLRILALQYGADCVYTEELVDRSLIETVRVENHALGTIDYIKDPRFLSKRTQRKFQEQNDRQCIILRIDPHRERGRIVCQLGTGEPDLALQAARHVCGDVDGIDINMGCPKKFSVSGGMGSALLSDPVRAARIVRTLRDNIPTVPVSCKIRLLPTTQQTVEFIDTMIHDGRVSAIAIHARTVGHDATIDADWTALKEVLHIVRAKYPTFPFLVNGDFYDRQERTDFLQQTKVNGVLLGRPALYNTSTFLPLQEGLLDKTAVIQEYIKLSVRYDAHYKNSKYVICEMMTNRRTPPRRVPSMPIKFEDGQSIATTCDCTSLQAMCTVWNVNYEDALSLRSKEVNGTIATQTTIGMETPTIQSAMEDERRYDDSYFLKHEEKKDQKEEGDDDNDEAKLRPATDSRHDEEKKKNMDDECCNDDAATAVAERTSKRIKI
jgi:tRNA-dihydrouridine synthase 2